MSNIKKDYSVVFIQLDKNLASDISARYSGGPKSIWPKRRKLSSYQVDSRLQNNPSSFTDLNWEMSLRV